MTEQIIELLKSSGADAWEVVDTLAQAWEFYFIGHELDQNRVRDVEHISVEVYRKLEDGKYLGSASEEISPTATGEEAKKIIDDLPAAMDWYGIGTLRELNERSEKRWEKT